MSALENVLKGYSAQMCRLSREDKLRRAFAPHCFDGSELYDVIDQELCGLEHAAAAAAIKAAVKQKYQDVVPLDAIVEIIAKLMEITWA